MVKRGAFTLVELIFVIVILAIMSMFAADLYSKIYRSYTHARAISELEDRTELTLSIIVNRLEDRIKDTTIGRQSTDNTFVEPSGLQETHDILEWLGQSESRVLGGNDVGWSGFIDLGNANNVKTTVATGTVPAQGRLVTPGSNLSSAADIMNSLMSKSAANFGVVFKNVTVENLQNAYGFDLNNGYNHQNVAVANANGADVLNVTDYPGTKSGGAVTTEISEHYYITHTAYAIVPVSVVNYTVGGTQHQQFNLELRYNYQPWQGQDYRTAPKALIAENVTMFRFKDDNGALAIKLCMRDGGRNFDHNALDLIICKSQVVF